MSGVGMAESKSFAGEADFEAPSSDGAFIVDLEGYEGPIDVLLTLAREKKIDITQISILPLAEQYLAFIADVRRRDLKLAADYLVMAAWLAYLKSRLLLPDLFVVLAGRRKSCDVQLQLQGWFWGCRLKCFKT